MIIKIARFLIASIRFLLFLLCVVIILIVYTLGIPFYGHSFERALIFRQAFITLSYPVMGIKLERKGHPPKGNYLFISNHRSYFDPVALLWNSRARPVGKMELRSWPLLGYAFRLSGAYFVKREDKSSRKQTRLAIREALTRGFSIFLCPEGTTHLQARTIEFKPATFYIAAELGIPVYPAAIEYEYPSDAWIGDESFVSHFFRTYGRPTSRIKVSYGPAVFARDADLLQDVCKKWLDTEMKKLQHEFGLRTDPDGNLTHRIL